MAVQTFEIARQHMLDGQIRPGDVTQHNLLAVMGRLPRELFVPKSKRELAYFDDFVPLAEGRFLLPPRVLAKMIQAANVSEGDSVLDVGAATGYSSAVLGNLAGSVISLEVVERLSGFASKALSEAGIDNVVTETGRLDAGYPGQAPYDVILVNGAISRRSQALEDQLSPGGRLVTLVQSGGAGRAYVYTRGPASVTERPLFDAWAPVLPGFEEKKGFVF